MKLGIKQFINSPSDFDCWLLIWGGAIIILGSVAVFLEWVIIKACSV